MGQPLQERWVLRHRERLPGTVFLCAGGLFDYVTARNPTPPHWVRRAGFEWLHRLLRTPRRTWRRYVLGLPLFGWGLARFSLARVLATPGPVTAITGLAAHRERAAGRGPR